MKDVVLKLEMAEIKYDVQFDSWLRNKVFNQHLRNSNPEAEEVSYNFEEKATDWLIRKIENCVGEIHGELAWAVCHEEESNLTTNHVNGCKKEWSIHLRFNDGWAGSTRALNTKAHKFVVASLLYEWNRACDKMDSAREYKAEAEERLGALYDEARSERVVLEPFRL